MSEMTIRLTDGEVYRDDKLIATVKDNGKIRFKHYSYKKHRDEIEYLISGDAEGEPVDIGLEPIEVPVPEVTEVDRQPHSDAPKHFFEEGNGKHMGEETPCVVEWRKSNWTKDRFNAKYASQRDILEFNYNLEGKKYNH